MGYLYEEKGTPYVWYISARNEQEKTKAGELDSRNRLSRRQLAKDIQAIVKECATHKSGNKALVLSLGGISNTIGALYMYEVTTLIHELGRRGLYNVKFENSSYYKSETASKFHILYNKEFVEYSTHELVTRPGNRDQVLRYLDVVKPSGITEIRPGPNNTILGYYNGSLRNLILFMNKGFKSGELRDLEHVRLSLSEKMTMVYMTPDTYTRPPLYDESVDNVFIPFTLRNTIKAYYKGVQYRAIKNKGDYNFPTVSNSLRSSYVYLEPAKQTDYFNRSCISAYQLKDYMNKYGNEQYHYAYYTRMLFYDEIGLLNSNLWVAGVEFVTYISGTRFRVFSNPRKYRDIDTKDLDEDTSLLYVPRIIAIDYNRIDEINGEIKIDWQLDNYIKGLKKRHEFEEQGENIQGARFNFNVRHSSPSFKINQPSSRTFRITQGQQRTFKIASYIE